MSITLVMWLRMMGSLSEGRILGGDGRMNEGVLWNWDRAGACEGPQPHAHPLPTWLFPQCPSLQTTLVPPGPPAPTAASPPAASNARPTITSTAVQTLSPAPDPAPGAPLAEQPHQDLPGAATTTSTDLDARTPVQESVSVTCQMGIQRSLLDRSCVVRGAHGRAGLVQGHPKQPLAADHCCTW